MPNLRINWVYILASHKNGTLYVGSTQDLELRLAEHRSGRGSRFVSRYKVFKLVYIEAAPDKAAALHREHQLKRWRRAWKIELIEADNPNWHDITDAALERVAREY